MAYIFKVYLMEDRECFVISRDKGRETKKDLAFSQSLLDMLYLDIYAHVDLFEQMGRDLRKLYETKDGAFALAVKKSLDKLAKLHIYFEFLRIDWYERLDKATAQGYEKCSDLLPYKKLTHIPSDIDTMQGQIQTLFSDVLDVLDVLSPQRQSIQEKMIAYCEQHKGKLHEWFSFSPLPINFEPVDNATFTDVLHPNNIYDIIDFFLRACIKREQLFKVCKNCNRYFTINSYTNTEYCDREYADTGRTCKAIGATQTYKKKIHENPVIGAYNKEYKKRFAWIKYGKIPKEAFYEWSKQAQAMRDRAIAGEVTFTEFEDWLRD